MNQPIKLVQGAIPKNGLALFTRLFVPSSPKNELGQAFYE
jgi:hypothetical protein